MALGQAARTLQAGAGLARGGMSNTNTLKLTMALVQSNALAEAFLLDMAIMRNLISGNQMNSISVRPTNQILRDARVTQDAVNERAVKRAKGLQGRLKSGKGRPDVEPPAQTSPPVEEIDPPGPPEE